MFSGGQTKKRTNQQGLLNLQGNDVAIDSSSYQSQSRPTRSTVNSSLLSLAGGGNKHEHSRVPIPVASSYQNSPMTSHSPERAIKTAVAYEAVRNVDYDDVPDNAGDAIFMPGTGGGNLTQEIVNRFLQAQEMAERKLAAGGSHLDGRSGGIVNLCLRNRVVRATFLFVAVILLILGVTDVVIEDIKKNKIVVAGDDEISTDADSFYTTSQPNIIFILADDLGYQSMGYNAQDIDFATPHLTALARRGIILDNYYAQEVCTPSRSALLTGRYPLTNGMQYSIIQPTTSYGLSLDEVLLPEVLRDNGYDTYAVGKWHLGHFSPRLLPTARGFDYFLGYNSGEGYYWSKKNPDHKLFTDMLESDAHCYAPYEAEDLHTYSTHLYRDKAIDIIMEQDTSRPFFLYLPFQAVHDPFSDYKHFTGGIPTEYLPEGFYDLIHDNTSVVGHKHRQMTMALSILDEAVGKIYDALLVKGIMENTIIAFASDNGGCYLSGGRNGNLRGQKGSLFEGGSKVDAFIFNPYFSDDVQGTSYSGLMHVTDWMPTLLDLVNITYTPDNGSAFDGFSHAETWASGNVSGESSRDFMLYNYFYGVQGFDFNLWTNGSFAIRDVQYKLMHTYDSNSYGTYLAPDELIDNDDSLAEGTCNQAFAATGTFSYFLFDLVNDPYEKVNLYENDTMADIKDALYAELDRLASNSLPTTEDEKLKNREGLKEWKAHGDYIVPWVKQEDLEDYAGTFPNDCYQLPTSSPTSAPTVTMAPTTRTPSFRPSEEGETLQPTTQEPSVEPSRRPSARPTRKPTLRPTFKPSASKTGPPSEKKPNSPNARKVKR